MVPHQGLCHDRRSTANDDDDYDDDDQEMVLSDVEDKVDYEDEDEEEDDDHDDDDDDQEDVKTEFEDEEEEERDDDDDEVSEDEDVVLKASNRYAEIGSSSAVNVTKEDDLNLEVGKDTQLRHDHLPFASTSKMTPGKGKQLQVLDGRGCEHVTQSLGRGNELSKHSSPVQRLRLDIFEDTRRNLGAEFLQELKNAPFREVRQKCDEASITYKSIEWLNGDTRPLKKQVEHYAAVVYAYLALEQAAAKRKRSEEVEKDIASQTVHLLQIDSNIAAIQREKEMLSSKLSGNKRKINDLEAELRIAREVDKHLTNSLAVMTAKVTSLNVQANAARVALENLAAIPTLSAEDEMQLKEYKRQLVEHQSSIKPLEWINFD